MSWMKAKNIRKQSNAGLYDIDVTILFIVALIASDPGQNKATFTATVTVTKANLVPIFTPSAGSCSVLEKQVGFYFHI